MKILVAEDDSISRMIIQRVLRELGHEAEIRENGRDAWSVYQAEPFRVVIIDWMMPYIDGLELCRLIRKEDRAPYTYLIMLTAMAGKGSYLEGMEAGADDFITKPFDPAQFAARLRVAERILGLQKEVKQLQGFIPICAYCKKARNDQQYWEELDKYLIARTDTQLSHGICPECYDKVVKPELEALRAARAARAVVANAGENTPGDAQQVVAS